MDWGAIEADILHVQNLMKKLNFNEAIEVIRKCLKALINSNITNEPLAHLSTVQQCLLVHLAMAFLYSEKFTESLGYFEKVNTRRIFNYISELTSSESTYGVERVFEASRDTLLHSYMNASVAAENCHRPQLTQSYLEKAIQLYREQQLVKHEAVTWHRLGKLMAKLQRHAQAGLSLNTASLLFKKCEQSVLEAESLCDLADVYWKSGHKGRVSDTMERTHSLCLKLARRPEEQRHLYRRISGLYREQRSHAEPEAAAPGDTGLERARAVLRRGQLLGRGDRERWERAMREAKEECELAVVCFPKEASKVLIGIANSWSDVGEYVESESILERVVELSRSANIEMILAEALERLGDVLIKQGREREAATRYNEASMVLELNYNETGEEKLGLKLQNVWNKHVSLNMQGMPEGQIILNGKLDRSVLVNRNNLVLLSTGTGKADDANCQDTVAFFSEVGSLGNCNPKSTEAEIHSLVTVSDLSEISGNENILTSDIHGNRPLSNQKNVKHSNVSSPKPEDLILPVNSNDKQKISKRIKSTQSTRTFALRRNRVSPVGSVSSRGSGGSAKNGQDLNLKPQPSRSCVIL